MDVHIYIYGNLEMVFGVISQAFTGIAYETSTYIYRRHIAVYLIYTTKKKGVYA